MVPAAGCQLAGYIPCQINTLMPDFKDVRNTVSALTKVEKSKLVILLSHLGGIINPHIQEIASFCETEGIVLIEDCAHSFGATLDGKHSGLFGDAGVYSLYSTKAIPAGEGGIIVTKDERIGQMIGDYSIYDRFKQNLAIGNNIRISEVQALLAFSVISEWQSILLDKVKTAEKYIKACNDLNIHYISQNTNGQMGNYYKFVVYNPNRPVLEQLNKLFTKTSPIYDYSIGIDNPLALLHACLPIWFNQDINVTNKVVSELYESTK
jgi:dTDP-4-amino-4,6-dideoxygalactose transaminase